MVRLRLYLYEDETRDFWSNIPFMSEGVPEGKPKRTPEGEGVYLTVYFESSPNTDSISFSKSLG